MKKLLLNHDYNPKPWPKLRPWAKKADPEPEPRPMTNGDKMRAMSDEELAAWCRDAVSCAVCPMLSACNGNIVTCTSRWYGYLKAAADV